jgi:hypothetical protein
MTTDKPRVELWNGTVHLDNGRGRPACGSAKRTHISWIWPSTNQVTCSKCKAKS